MMAETMVFQKAVHSVVMMVSLKAYQMVVQ
jgi:hypothetical protein